MMLERCEAMAPRQPTPASRPDGRRRPAATAGYRRVRLRRARNEMLDGEGVAAEVLFPDADVLGTGRIASSPFGTGLAGGPTTRPEPIRRREPGPQPLARRLLRRGTGPPHRRRRDPRDHPRHGRSRSAESARRRSSGLRGILIPTRWFDRPAYHDPCYEPLWTPSPRSSAWCCTRTPARARRLRPRARACSPIYATEAGWWAARPLLGPDLGRRLRAPPEACKYSMAENGGVVGARPDPQDGREVGRRPQHPQVRRRVPARAVDEAERRTSTATASSARRRRASTTSTAAT